ncbi:hypothetical protein H109_02788 [Trichophyton interdigitale MR816]|uniref:Origin recognition complex subunit 1 n=1 Tax=Trichophyton interdigitale (strain MR816) TaxID=1215338 RepID=A0A059JC50_TRIIM|nr:hypothetical protein H101_00546 [Trichophyton interdigitale H6]KDB25374.1 hypothetical protein H109_02788 [Trichophyton interdigitale MR816]
MAAQDTPETKSKRAQEIARQWLTKGGIFHEDSDDELGSEDLPWEWIYEEPQPSPAKPSKGKKSGPKIIGARMGSFECRIGHIVLLKSPEAGKDWAGIIYEFLDDLDPDSGEIVKSMNLMWFTSPDEFLSTKNKKRADALPNEQYITTDFNINPLMSINGRATVMSKDAFYKKYPDGKPPKGKAAAAEFNKCIICRRGVKQLQGRYTDEFIWENIYTESEDGVFELVEFIREALSRARKRAQKGTGPAKDKQDDYAPSTPRKRQKTESAAGTPQSRQRQKYLTTPTHKRIKVKRPLEFTPLSTRTLSPSHFTASPYRQARNLLHVSSVPTSLPCRDAEFNSVYDSLHTAISDGTGTCIYISGPPGTGKTATVRDVIAHLNTRVLDEEMDDFIFVEINGMKVTDPHQSYSMLWEALKGDRISPSHALDLLSREFSRPSPRRVPCVVLMDELDQLVTKNQSVMYNFFNWPALRHSRLVVLAVANTMDLPERTLSNKISSRLGLTRITFSGYKYQELMEIIGSRLENVPGNIVDADAIQFASRKVAAVSGDARRALDICRRAVEIAEQISETKAREKHKSLIALANANGDADLEFLPPTPSKSVSRRKAAAAILSSPRKGDKKGAESTTEDSLPRVTIATIKQAIQEATSTPLQQALRCLPLASKVLLAGLLARIRRTGINESTVGDILDEAKRISDAATSVSSSSSTKLKEALICNSRIQGMGFATVDLIDAGLVVLEGGHGTKSGDGMSHALGKGNRSSKVRLRIAAEDARAAFRDDPEGNMLGLGAEG